MEKQLLNFELDPVRPDNRIVFSAYTLSKAQDIEFISVCFSVVSGYPSDGRFKPFSERADSCGCLVHYLLSK